MSKLVSFRRVTILRTRRQLEREEGIVVHELEGGDYVVEKVEPNGYSTWIAWFRESELTPLD